jgi:hypothetical protein
VPLTQQFAHVLLFSCPECSRPLASACASPNRNLEVADAHWFNPHCRCGWTGDVMGVIAVKHWVEAWQADTSIRDGKGGSCDGTPIERTEIKD